MDTLRQIRKADPRKLTQQDVADYLGVERSTYGKYETGSSEPTFETIHKLSQFFEVPITQLMGVSDKSGNEPEIKKAPSSDELDAIPGMQELERVMGRLSEAGRQAVLEQAQTLLRLEKSLKEEK